MEAITLANSTAELNLHLVRKPEQPAIPKDTLSTYLQSGQARDKLSSGKLVGMVVKSKIDRLIARR